MDETQAETTLCEGCQQPMATPASEQFGPVLVQPRAWCKDCRLQHQILWAQHQHLCHCPYKTPHWRPRL